ncbi:hypothetical protein ACR79B_20610 [Sphingobacterium spiritivorum]|uniref:hypothetical protein n=1 Tax=Sphingobacterium spiritivorum TaxID=258 RepID=UPI003DA5F456
MYPKLTAEAKLQAFQSKFYQGVEWDPKKGDYYTTTRSDLELYQVVDVDDNYVYTSYLHEGSPIDKWPKDGFTTEGFGDRRMYVPDNLLKFEGKETKRNG